MTDAHVTDLQQALDDARAQIAADVKERAQMTQDLALAYAAIAALQIQMATLQGHPGQNLGAAGGPPGSGSGSSKLSGS